MTRSSRTYVETLVWHRHKKFFVLIGDLEIGEPVNLPPRLRNFKAQRKHPSGRVAKVKVRVKKMGAAQVTVLSAITRGLTMTIEELAMPIPDDRFMMVDADCLVPLSTSLANPDFLRQKSFMLGSRFIVVTLPN